jgi:hypothetical protein
MPHYKMVDGVKIELTPEEETALLERRAEVQAENAANLWLSNRKDAYRERDLFEQLDDLIKAIHSATALEDIKSSEIVTWRMGIKEQFPKPE